MGQVNKVNIKNKSYYFCNDTVDGKNFHSDLLKIDKSRMKTLIFTILVLL